MNTSPNATLNGWSLDITAVPEPVNVALVVFAVVLVSAGGIRRYSRMSKAATV